MVQIVIAVNSELTEEYKVQLLGGGEIGFPEVFRDRLKVTKVRDSQMD